MHGGGVLGESIANLPFQIRRLWEPERDNRVSGCSWSCDFHRVIRTGCGVTKITS